MVRPLNSPSFKRLLTAAVAKVAAVVVPGAGLAAFAVATTTSGVAAGSAAVVAATVDVVVDVTDVTASIGT